MWIQVMMDFINSMNKQLFSALLLGALFSPVVWAECDFDDFPVMDSMRTQLIMADTVYNHRPMTVRSFSSDSTLNALLNFYHRRWKDNYSDSLFGSWTQVSSLDDECLMTVQAGEVDGVGTAGRLVMSDVPDADLDAPLGEGVLSPTGATIVSDMSSVDGPKHGRVTVITSDLSVSEAAQFYTSQMQSSGWWLQDRFAQQGRAVLVFRQGLDESNIAIVPAGEYTQILINEVQVK